MEVLFLIVLFLGLVLNGIPVGISFAISGFIGIWIIRGLDVALSLLGSIPYTWASSPLLLSMPLFVFMGFLAFEAEISKDLYLAASRWLGSLPGGIAIATTVANAGFGAICGSAQAAAAAMSLIAFAEMESRSYDRKLSTGSLAAGGTLSFLIPPSIPLIIYGVLAEVSIAKLFIAGIVPGLLLAAIYSAIIYIMCKRNPDLGPPGPKYQWKEKVKALKGVWGMLTLFIAVMGGMYAGMFSPSEGGAIGAFGAFLLGVISKRLSWKKILRAAKESSRLVCFIIAIIIGAQVFNTYLGIAGFSYKLSEWVFSLQVSKYVILLSVVVIFVLIGMFLDIAAILLLMIPTLAPIMSKLGFDLVWLGILLVLLQSLGFISPPIGVNAFIVQGTTKVPISIIFRGSIPFMIGLLFCILIIVVFPEICTFLPALMD